MARLSLLGLSLCRLIVVRVIMVVANDGSLGIGSDISRRLPGVEMVVGQANKSDQEDDGAGHKDRRPVRTHLTEHCGQAILFSDARTFQIFRRGNEKCRQGHKKQNQNPKRHATSLGMMKKKTMVSVMKKERRTVKKEEERREEQSKKRNQVLIRPEKTQGGCGR
jgi:hypothetical protein